MKTHAGPGVPCFSVVSGMQAGPHRWLAGWLEPLPGRPAVGSGGGTRQEFGGAPRCGGQADSGADGPRPAVGNAACCPQPAGQLQGPQGKDRNSSGDSDNDFVKETAFCPNKILWERDTAVSCLQKWILAQFPFKF